MKSITNTGKTCKPRHIPNSEKKTPNELQHAYDEIADQYEKKTWSTSTFSVWRASENIDVTSNGKILTWHAARIELPMFPATGNYGS